MNLKTASALSLIALALFFPPAIGVLEARHEILLTAVFMLVLTTISAWVAYRSARTEQQWILGTLLMICNCVLVMLSIMLLGTEPPNVVPANESRAVCALMNLAKANVAYAKRTHHYVSRLAELDGPEMSYCPTVAEEVIRKGSAADYLFDYVAATSTGFQIVASPKKPGRTGVRSFYVDQDLKIHYGIAQATAQSPTIGD